MHRVKHYIEESKYLIHMVIFGERFFQSVDVYNSIFYYTLSTLLHMLVAVQRFRIKSTLSETCSFVIGIIAMYTAFAATIS